MPRMTLTLAIITVLAAPAAARAQTQLELPRPSPKAEVTQEVGLTEITVAYSSPGVKGRKIWGELVPYDQMWRTGANQDTTVTFSKDVKVAGKDVKAGTYTLYTVPSKKGWTVIINSNPEDAGHSNYDKKKDVARFNANGSSIPHRERLTFLFANTTDDKTRLDLEWEKVRVSIPIEVDTKNQAVAAIKQAADRGWVDYARAANYLRENGDLAAALQHANTSISLKKTWWNHWVKAQILAGQGKVTEAVAAVEASHKLGGDSGGYAATKPAMEKAVASWKKNKS